MSGVLDEGGNGSSAETMANNSGNLIVDSDTERFTEDVINMSTHVPVIVDFWAPWCEPCKQMTPVLEKLVEEYGGQVKLVKINIDENQALAQQLRVQSIPMVYAFKDGRPADVFNGALPESQLRKFIEKLTGGEGSPLDQAVDQAQKMFEGGDTISASMVYNQILEADSFNASAHAGMIKCLMADDKNNEARDYLSGLTEDLLKNPLIKAAQTALELAEQSANTGDDDNLKVALDADPNNHQIRYDYAIALYGGGKTEEAIENLVDIIKLERTWNDDAARQQLFKIFEALGHGDPITVEGRRKLSVVLFA
jgi:putative thioredoxin